MSTLQEQFEETKVLLSANGWEGTPAQFAAWADAAMDDPQMRLDLSQRLRRQFGADVDAAA